MKELEGFKLEMEKNAIGLLGAGAMLAGGALAGGAAYGAYSHNKAKKKKEEQLDTMRHRANMFGKLTPRMNPKMM